MVNTKECEKEGCENTFDVDNGGTWVSVTILENGELETNYYCCRQHKP